MARTESPAMEACTSFAYDLHGIPVVVKAGSIHRADDAAVRRFPDAFVPVGTPDAERPHPINDFLTVHGTQTRAAPADVSGGRGLKLRVKSGVVHWNGRRWETGEELEGVRPAEARDLLNAGNVELVLSKNPLRRERPGGLTHG